MQFIRFLTASLILSFPIFLRILPIYFVTVFLVGAVFLASINYILVFQVFMFVAWMPILVFMAMNAVRAGLVHRRESRGPDLSLMVKKTLHWAGVFWVISLVFGVFSYAAVALLGTQDNLIEIRQDLRVIMAPAEVIVPDLQTGTGEPRAPLLPGGIVVTERPNAAQTDAPAENSDPTQPTVMAPATPAQVPSAAALPDAPLESAPAEGASVTYAGNGLQLVALTLVQWAYLAVLSGLAVPFVAAAASIGVRGPNHEFFYGAGRRIKSILGISVAISVLQGMVISMIAKASGTAMLVAAVAIVSTELAGIPITGVIGLVLVVALLIYSTCISAASAVVGYIEAKSFIAEEKEAELSQTAYHAEPEHDIGAMMRERSERARMYKNPVTASSEDDAATDEVDAGPFGGDAAGAVFPTAEPRPVPPKPSQPYDPYAKRVAAGEAAQDTSDAAENRAEPPPAAPIEAPDVQNPAQPPLPETAASHAEMAAGFRRTRRLPPTAADAVKVPDDDNDPDWLKDLMADDDTPEPKGKKS